MRWFESVRNPAALNLTGVRLGPRQTHDMEGARVAGQEVGRNIIQIIPRRSSRADGIGDYGTLLAEAMLERAGYNSVFVSGTPERMEPPRVDSWQTHPVVERSSRRLAQQLSALCRDSGAACMIVHVSGYGYQKRGAPLWLLNGIRSWRRTHRDFHLFGIFHELFATGRVWNSSFWLSKVQEYVTRGIWKLCDGGLTTTSPYYDQLASWRPEMKRLNLLQTKAVFSNCRGTRLHCASRKSSSAYGGLRPTRN